MMRKFSVLFLTAVLICVLAVTALADLVVIPGDPTGKNRYFDRRMHDSLTLIAQDYQVPDGMTVTVYESPEDGGILETMTVGDIITISYSIEVDDEIWGIGRTGAATIGWVRLGRLQKIYSCEDFLEDYSSHIDQPLLAFLDVSQFTEPIYEWTYPGSGVLVHVLEPEYFSPEYYHKGILEYRKIYTDPNGGRWGYMTYFLAQSKGWIYLDDLHNPSPAFLLNPVVKNTVTDTAPTEEEPKSSLPNSILWIGLLVLFVSSVTVFAIHALKRMGKKNS